MNDHSQLNTVDLLHLASSHQIIDDYWFTESGVFIQEGNAKLHFGFDEAELFLRGLISWFSIAKDRYNS